MAEYPIGQVLFFFRVYRPLLVVLTCSHFQPDIDRGRTREFTGLILIK